VLLLLSLGGCPFQCDKLKVQSSGYLADDLPQLYRWESRDLSKTSGEGTHVDVEAIKKLVTQALATLPP
jgi:flagellin-specific chaperone FliS